MTPVLAATGRTNYCEELPRHLNHLVTIYPDYILKYLENGGFAVSLSFNPASSVLPDECHEMTINKDMALQVPARLSNENIVAISNYLPYRADMRKSWSVIEALERKESEYVLGDPKKSTPVRSSVCTTKDECLELK